MAFFIESSSVKEAPSTATPNVSLRQVGVTPSVKAVTVGGGVEGVMKPPSMSIATEEAMT